MGQHISNLKEGIKLMTNHPYNKIDMQVHHLISKKSITKLNKKHQKILEKKGYNIDDIGNLVALPYHMQGACQLEVQLHRADHKHATLDDDGHAISYHKKVKDKVEYNLDKYDDKDDPEICSTRKVQDVMNDVSKEILIEIADFNWALTSQDIFSHFENGESTGCCGVLAKAGVDSFRIKEKKGEVCSMTNRSGERESNGEAKVHNSELPDTYTLKAGQ